MRWLAKSRRSGQRCRVDGQIADKAFPRGRQPAASGAGARGTTLAALHGRHPDNHGGLRSEPCCRAAVSAFACV
jgi:hypothetical protein